MAISDSQKVDLLWKKVGFSKMKTDTNANKKAPNEAIVSDPIIKTTSIWSQSSDIPGTIPASNSSILHVYSDALSGALETTEDGTSSDNRTWKTNSTNWIPPSFGATFQLKVYAAPTGLANAQSTGTQLFETGSGNDDQWYYDYQSGVLHFIGTNLPTDIGTATSNVIYVSGAKYVGSTGIGDAIGASQTYFKADLSAVYADSDIKTGDVLVVTDGGDGEYAVYISNVNNPSNTGQLTAISTRDSATVDAGTLRSNVVFNSGNVTLGDVSSGSKVTDVTITVTTIFDSASAGITVGDDSDPDRLFSNDYVDLTSLGSYVVNPDFVYTGTLDSANTIKAFVSQGTSTQGAATVTINYS